MKKEDLIKLLKQEDDLYVRDGITGIIVDGYITKTTLEKIRLVKE